MKINEIDKHQLFEFVYKRRAEFMMRIHLPEVFIVKQFYERELVGKLRSKVHESGLLSEPTWHPLRDGCPDYHRLHDNYAGAHVKAKMHGHYYHGWYEHNRGFFDMFKDIFLIKAALGEFDATKYLHSIPSRGPVARVNFQNYPRGGGYIAEHIDPNSSFALIQTLVQASVAGSDFTRGGLFAREHLGGNKVYLDPLTVPGDLIILSPAIPHGVDPINPETELNWHEDSGKWTILPLFVAPDYNDPRYVKPRQL